MNDIPPRRGLTRATIELLCSARGQTVRIETPGEVTEDADGIPTAVGPTRTSIAAVGRVTITRREADELGIVDGEYPGLRIIETNKE